MNLLTDSWLPVVDVQRNSHKIALADIANLTNFDFGYPRADLQGAAYQFAIGVLQTLFAPEDIEAWEELFKKPPGPQQLQSAFDQAKSAFELTGDGPKFMQDREPLEQKTPNPIAALLIEAPGAQTIKQNTDHFIKRGLCEHMDLASSAMALYTLQINAPAGGQGHRTSLRGGGGLTTLLKPNGRRQSLWHKLWLNVIPEDSFNRQYGQGYSTRKSFTDGSVFPWTAATKVSKAKDSELLSDEVHPLHMYWAMPRRIQLLDEQGVGRCCITGEASEQLVGRYLTQNYGNNYSGTWHHPLTPYRHNPKKPEDANYSVKAQPGGLTYRHWHTMLFKETEKEGFTPAFVVHNLMFEKYLSDQVRADEVSLWAFGFDMDNQKARGWYSVEFPIVLFEGENTEQCYQRMGIAARSMVALADEYRKLLSRHIKLAWFGDRADAKGDFGGYEQRFWQKTELKFYALIQGYQQDLANKTEGEAKGPQEWLRYLTNVTETLFDELVMGQGTSADATVKRISARSRLFKLLHQSKVVKDYKKQWLTE